RLERGHRRGLTPRNPRRRTSPGSPASVARGTSGPSTSRVSSSRLWSMDRRGLRAVVVLVVVAVAASVLLAAGGPDQRRGSAAGPGSPDPLAGPTADTAIGPTAIPGSSIWDEILAP